MLVINRVNLFRVSLALLHFEAFSVTDILIVRFLERLYDVLKRPFLWFLSTAVILERTHTLICSYFETFERSVEVKVYVLLWATNCTSELSLQ